MTIGWNSMGAISTQEWTCAYCDRDVASDRGWQGVAPAQHGGPSDSYYFLAICPRCSLPTFISTDDGAQVPQTREGEAVKDLPEDVAALYDEARDCMRAGAPSGAVLLARKLLMHVAVERGAKEGESFKAYVEYLASSGIVTADMKDWVDEIRELGNDANHELVQMDREEAKELLTFVVSRTGFHGDRSTWFRW